VKKRLIFFTLALTAIVALGILLLYGNNIPVLNPQGIIASRQRDLIIFTVVLSMVVVIPVFILLFMISWKYREGNKKTKKYTPNWDGNKALEAVWWRVPIIIILILSVVTWRTSHELDPYKPLDSAVKPITIEVVALQWKWLFIYPEQEIASVNMLQFPEKTPVNFKLTSDAPMNAFWIPSLGGQVYAMSGMSSRLSLMADGVGSYDGRSANISGEGFAKMKFIARSSTSADFEAWTQEVRRTSSNLTMEEYNQLASPGVPDRAETYVLTETSLYDKIVMKYMMPGEEGDGMKKVQDQHPDSPAEHDMSDHHDMEGM
jgi:cytochrome o ubiquinol oxidase subunit 2